VLLRRSSTQFKDYEKCPIGFGVVIFCIATAANKSCRQLYERFYKEFSPFGEPNVAIDTGARGGSPVKLLGLLHMSKAPTPCSFQDVTPSLPNTQSS
jgi:hypothetical protein